MTGILVFFFVVFILLLFLVVANFRRFRSELSYLPKMGVTMLTDPLIGYPLVQELPFLLPYANQPFLVQLASPTCPSCHRETAALAESRFQGNIVMQVVCLLHTNDPETESSRAFQAKYQAVFDVITVGDDVIKERLHLEKTPLLLLIDAQGVVRMTTGSVNQMLKQFAVSQVPVRKLG